MTSKIPSPRGEHTHRYPHDTTSVAKSRTPHDLQKTNNLLHNLPVSVQHSVVLLGLQAVDDLCLGDGSDVELAAADDPVDAGAEEDETEDNDGVVHLKKRSQ